MSKYVLAPDSFKGSLSSRQICHILSQEIQRLEPQAEVCSIPVADGGEGTVETFLTAVGGRLVTAPCHGPYGEERQGFYGLLPDGTAVIEMAAAAGLPLVGERKDPSLTTTYGVGELILHAANSGARRILLGLGGSATNDGGCGMAAAVGVKFYNRQGNSFLPVGATLGRIAHVDTGSIKPQVRQLSVAAMCDIDNPLCGRSGAAAVFAPQKGADGEMVQMLEENLCHLAGVIWSDLGIDVLALPGGGAAGGMGAGCVAFLGCTLELGIEAMLRVARFDQRAAGSDLVVTGEGHLDGQTVRGKTVVGVARRARALGIPAVALVGGCQRELEQLYAQGLCGVLPICPAPVPLQQAMEETERNLRFAVGNLVHLARGLRGN